MTKEIKYTDAPQEVEAALNRSKSIVDFLPAPEDLVFKTEKEKVTMMINKQSLDFFRAEAKKHGVPYQTMINNLIESYTKRMSS